MDGEQPVGEILNISELAKHLVISVARVKLLSAASIPFQ